MLPHLRHGRTLLTARDIVLNLEGGRVVGPWNGSIQMGQRIGVRTAFPEQWEALAEVLTGQRVPEKGRLEEIEQVRAQSDVNIKASLDLNRSITDFLHSPDAPEFVWLEGRRKVLWVLLDALEIRPDMTRMALKLIPEDILDKFCALRFMVSRAEVLVGREIFASHDEAVRKALSRRWLDFTGTVIAAESHSGALPGHVDAWWIIDGEGRVFEEKEQGSPAEEEGPCES